MAPLATLRRRVARLSALALCALSASPLAAVPVAAQAGEAAAAWHPGAPAELFEVVEVVDGDTLHVLRGGRLEKLRLASVDTEEKLSSGASRDPLKPRTVFGEECALWAKRFFADLAEDGARPKVGLLFPDAAAAGGERSREARDVYGRLLCHVILPDGRDFNLLLVQLGKSPYYNKYGNDLLCHEAFVAAQREARARKIGIWDPRTNRPRTAGAPRARRDYARLLAWWEARAQAVEAYRARRADNPAGTADAEDPASLSAAARSGDEVAVFCSVDRLFDERDGSLTVLMRAVEPERALRVSLAAERRGAFDAHELARRSEPFRQNYLWAHGRLERDRRGWRMEVSEPSRLALAGPEPALRD
ncbi:MAG TPA: thermonuclease family protein [Planctomycetota bacterium]|nr:thermonuclease family protein [Planctomycetota bacterium]